MVGDSLVVSERATSPAPDTSPVAPAPPVAAQDTDRGRAGRHGRGASDLFRYEFSTRGARLIGAVLADYNYTIDSLKAQSVELMRPGSDLLALRLIVGRDTYLDR